jgi:hypothetical protein
LLSGSDASNRVTDEKRFEGLYEVIRAYTRDVNEDGLPAIYVRTFSYYCQAPAGPRRLLPYKHGKLPFVWFAREHLTSKLQNTRGITGLVTTQQASLKLTTDAFEDHVQTTALPALQVPAGANGRPKYNIVLGPNSQVPRGLRETYEYIQRPPFPVGLDRHRDAVKGDVNEYFGRPSKEAAPETVQMRRQARVERFLSSLGDALLMALQLFQQYAEDALVQRVVGGSGLPVARSREEIQGMFDIWLSLDSRELDVEQLKEKAELVLNYVQRLDRRQTVQYHKIAARVLESIDANWAEESLLPENAADEREEEEEKANFVKMLAGVRPARPSEPGVQNYGLRMQVLQDELAVRQQNPGAFPELSPAAAALIQEQVEFLQFQMQQLENADTGRTGVKETDLATVGMEGGF